MKVTIDVDNEEHALILRDEFSFGNGSSIRLAIAVAKRVQRALLDMPKPITIGSKVRVIIDNSGVVGEVIAMDPISPDADGTCVVRWGPLDVSVEVLELLEVVT